MKKLEYLPRIYRLGWDTPTATLFVSFNKEEIPKMKKWLDAPNRFMLELVKPLSENPINIESFGKPVSFGFDDVFIFENENETEITYKWTLEPMRKIGNKKCTDCNGTGTHKINDRRCYKCRGGGKELEDVENNFHSGMFTLWTLTKVADYLATSYISDEPLPENKLEQDIMCLFSHTSGRHKCFSSGWISDEVLKWLVTIDEKQEKQIAEAMRKAEDLLLLKTNDAHDFRVNIYEDGRFWLSVPGDACTLGPSTHGINTYQVGHMLFDHNVDHRFQQIAFIAGLAKTQDLFSKRISK